MARNIEIKARVADMPALMARAAAIADSGPVEIPQDDTFFRCDNGRLKRGLFGLVGVLTLTIVPHVPLAGSANNIIGR